MALSEAEIQVLASLQKAEMEGGPADRSSLEAESDRFWIFLEDWSNAYRSLVVKGLIEGDDDGYSLTESGRPMALSYHRQRPDMYWYYYQRFYQAARASAAHSELCRRVFQEDLCQEGQTDMASLNQLLDGLDLQPGEHVLDLGCGAGVIAEYIAERRGVVVTGLDYAAPAIAEANQRTAGKRSRLTFLLADMNALDLPAGSLDAVVSLDALYWASDLEDTLSRLAAALKPGGRMGLFMNHHVDEGEILPGWRPNSPSCPKPYRGWVCPLKPPITRGRSVSSGTGTGRPRRTCRRPLRPKATASSPPA